MWTLFNFGLRSFNNGVDRTLSLMDGLSILKNWIKLYFFSDYNRANKVSLDHGYFYDAKLKAIIIIKI